MSADDICDQIRVGAKWLTVHQCLRDEHLPSASRCHLGMERATPPSRRSSSWRSCWQFVVTSECRLPHELVCCRKSAHEVEVEIRTFAFKFIKEEFLDTQAPSSILGTGPRASLGILGHPHAQYIEVKIMPSVVYCNNTVLAQKIQISRQKNQFFFQKIWSYEYSAWWELRFDTSYIVKSWTLFNCIMNPQIRPLCVGERLAWWGVCVHVSKLSSVNTD